MKDIIIDAVSKTYRNELILEKISLKIPGGKFFALLGPSGCGKTTLLRMIGGFESVDAGRIYLGSEDITDLPVNERRINTVFQNYALFPHLNVFENVAYSQQLKKQPQDVIEEKVLRVIKAMNLENQLYKSVSNLSGGQQQRVALARAIINEPDVLLLDEPLAALDLKLRERMLIELIDLQEKLRTTFIYVTHDQFEALTVADQMAIMNQDGEIEQIGSPKEIYEFPVTSFVAQFVGSTNIFEGIFHDHEGYTAIEIPDLGTFSLVVPPERALKHQAKIIISIRPEKFVISSERRKQTTKTNYENCVEGVVESIVYHGRSTQYNVRLKNQQLVQAFEQNEEHAPQQTIDYDERVYLYWQKESAVIVAR